ncbi:response regulator [Paenibacillus sp. GCM10028914]|uniref:response regulator n=1 Tax=Paenibacillus sp. GCM10028914 TaxID=3273416 RepID=UPI00360A8830
MYKIIIADDEKMIKRSLRALVARLGDDFVLIGEASNGKDALELVRKNSPHILITDICMPEMDGMELIAEVRKCCGQVKVIVISGHAEFKYAHQALRYNVTDYLLKPIEPESLMSLLKSFFDQDKLEGKRLAGRIEPRWHQNAEQLFRSLWSGQEKELIREVERFQQLVEESTQDDVLVADIYLDQVAYIRRRAAGMCSRISEELLREEAEPSAVGHPSEWFKAACIDLFHKAARLRGLGQTQQIRKALSYIDSHMGSYELSLTGAAEHAAMSVTYFSRFFKEETGMSFVRYVTNLRMEKAKQLLTETNLTVWAVAESIGYSTYHHFAKVFRKETGMTPTEYRRLQKYIDD